MYSYHCSTTHRPRSADREKIIQETRLADHVLVACGASMSTLNAILIFVHDLALPRQAIFHSDHFKGLLNRNLSRTRTTSLWRLVVNHYDYQCADTRDRVFGLLYLSADNAIRADYTKSTVQVLLQLMQQTVLRVGDEAVHGKDTVSMADVGTVISGFHLGPLATEIADMLRLRRSAHATPNHVSSQKLVFDHRNQRHILLKTDLCCAIWEDDAGNLVTSLLKQKPPSTQDADRYLHHVEQHSKDVAVIRLRNPLGKVVALADKKVKAGDILLFFREGALSRPPGRPPRGSTLSPPTAGLIIRPVESGIHIVVGQAVIDHGIRTRHQKRRMPGETTDPMGFELENDCWWVLMCPVDLLLFASQDMKAEVGPFKEGVGSVIRRTYCPEETAKRLNTSVTTDLNSSYAIRRQGPGDLSPPASHAIVLRSDSMGFL